MRPVLPRPVGISSKISKRAVPLAGVAHALPISGRRQVGDGAGRLANDGGDVALARST